MSSPKSDAADNASLKKSLSALAKATGQGSNQAGPEAWTLPSGEELLHFALKGGFLAPSILNQESEPAAPAKRNRGKR